MVLIFSVSCIMAHHGSPNITNEIRVLIQPPIKDTFASSHPRLGHIFLVRKQFGGLGRGRGRLARTFSLPSWKSPSPNFFAFEKVVTEGSWRRTSAPEEERLEAQRVPRRRCGPGRRSRPRPLSDYGQPVSLSLSIPEDAIAVDPQKEDTEDGDHQPSGAPIDPADQTPAGGCPRGAPRRRPISVIGGVGFYGSSQAEEGEAILPQVSPGGLPPEPLSPAAAWPLSSGCKLTRKLNAFLSSLCLEDDVICSQPFFLTLKTCMN